MRVIDWPPREPALPSHHNTLGRTQGAKHAGVHFRLMVVMCHLQSGPFCALPAQGSTLRGSPDKPPREGSEPALARVAGRRPESPGSGGRPTPTTPTRRRRPLLRRPTGRYTHWWAHPGARARGDGPTSEISGVRSAIEFLRVWTQSGTIVPRRPENALFNGRPWVRSAENDVLHPRLWI